MHAKATAARWRAGRAQAWGRALAALTLALALAGCAQATATAEAIAIRFAFPEADQAFYERLAQAFHTAHPALTVELLPLSFRARAELDPSAADVLTGHMRALYEQRDRLLELDPLIERDSGLHVDDFYPGALAVLSSEGRIWAIPAGTDMYVMYYSRDLFDQFSVPYPQPGWTWEDFLSRATALSHPEAGYYAYTAIPGHADTLLFIYQHGGSIVDDLHNPTRLTFDEPLNVEALEWYRALFTEYRVAPTPTQARAAFGGGAYAVYQGIRSGRVAMWTLSLSDRGGLMWPVEWTTDWGMASLPRDARAATLAWVEGYAISAQAEHPDACWEWIRFLSGQLHYRLAPVRRSLAESEAFEQAVGDEMAAVVRDSLESALLLSPQLWVGEFGAALEAFDRAVTAVTEGTLEPWEALERLQEGAPSQ